MSQIFYRDKGRASALVHQRFSRGLLQSAHVAEADAENENCHRRFE